MSSSGGEQQRLYRGRTRAQVAGAIDHSVLKPTSLSAEVTAAAATAEREQNASLCIRPIDVAVAAPLLSSSRVPLCTVVGFPHGTTTTAVKVFETLEALRAGCKEVDMVINQSAMAQGDYQAVADDIRAVCEAAHSHRPDAVVKVIFETCALASHDELRKCCELAEAAGADFVKTSTGFGSAGATVEHVGIMRAAVGDRLKVKASGGIRTLDQLCDLLDAGADRCGCSATESILKEFDERASAVC